MPPTAVGRGHAPDCRWKGPCPRLSTGSHPHFSPGPLPARSRPGTSLCRGCHIPEIVPDDFRDERPLSGRAPGLKRSICCGAAS
jgi:hypothetical protein